MLLTLILVALLCSLAGYIAASLVAAVRDARKEAEAIERRLKASVQS